MQLVRWLKHWTDPTPVCRQGKKCCGYHQATKTLLQSKSWDWMSVEGSAVWLEQCSLGSLLLPSTHRGVLLYPGCSTKPCLSSFYMEASGVVSIFNIWVFFLCHFFPFHKRWFPFKQSQLFISQPHTFGPETILSAHIPSPCLPGLFSLPSFFPIFSFLSTGTWTQDHVDM